MATLACKNRNQLEYAINNAFIPTAAHLFAPAKMRAALLCLSIYQNTLKLFSKINLSGTGPSNKRVRSRLRAI